MRQVCEMLTLVHIHIYIFIYKHIYMYKYIYVYTQICLTVWNALRIFMKETCKSGIAESAPRDKRQKDVKQRDMTDET